MNYFLEYLEARREQLDLPALASGSRWTSVLLTPRFRASNHVVALLLVDGDPRPLLVAKVPRLSDGGASLRREAANLRMVQRLRPEGLRAVPKVIAFEDYRGRPILVETALQGAPLDPPRVRRNWTFCCDAGLRFLEILATARAAEPPLATDELEAAILHPLDLLTEQMCWDGEERSLWNRTREIVAPLCREPLPSVVEHGDFSHPNVMLLEAGELGVVDWEMAEPRGLPLHDLAFYLTYIAFARHRVRENGRVLPAVQSAFFGEDSWGGKYLRRYAQDLEIRDTAVGPLFLLCWVRYLAGLVRRLREDSDSLHEATASWLRQNRYYAIWRHTVTHYDELRIAAADRTPRAVVASKQGTTLGPEPHVRTLATTGCEGGRQ